MIEVMMFIVPILTVSIIIFMIFITFNPKLRGKFMSHQIKATKYMFDESKNDLTDIASTAGDVLVKANKNIIDNNEDILKDVSRKTAEIESDAIEIKARALKKGLSNDVMFCKHCGASIDADSSFCKFCGKEL